MESWLFHLLTFKLLYGPLTCTLSWTLDFLCIFWLIISYLHPVMFLKDSIESFIFYIKVIVNHHPCTYLATPWKNNNRANESHMWDHLNYSSDIVAHNLLVPVNNSLLCRQTRTPHQHIEFKLLLLYFHKARAQVPWRNELSLSIIGSIIMFWFPFSFFFWWWNLHNQSTRAVGPHS